MNRVTKKTAGLLIAAAALVLVGGAVFAYWTNTGTGTGSTTTGTNGAITIVQTDSSVALVPGGPSSTVSGTFDNPNTGPVHVTSVTATLASVTGSVGTPACTVADYQLETDTVAVGAQAAEDDTTTWSGIKIRMLNSATNQDACKNATIHLAYTSN